MWNEEEQAKAIQERINDIDIYLDALKGNSTITIFDGNNKRVVPQCDLANKIAQDAKDIADIILWK
ncbi:hypothetical protein [Companilactobacillus sp. HBUAS59699]|uniref:hypothetical protein n=1 Tax=Companilactobacillus sp. HBUAS59699 TaxID=3109358 RepID=UPI002FF268C5